MYINTGVGKRKHGHKVSIIAWDAESRDRIELTIYRGDRQEVKWCSISLNPQQAIKVAHRLQNPLPDAWVDYADPDPPPAAQGEIRAYWDVFIVKDKNGNKASIGIAEGKLGVSSDQYYPSRSGPTDYFSHDHAEDLTPQEIKKLAGLLYHWAGAELIGLVREKKKLVRKILPLVDKQNLEVEEYYADHWRDDDSPQAEKTFGVKVA